MPPHATLLLQRHPTPPCSSNAAPCYPAPPAPPHALPTPPCSSSAAPRRTAPLAPPNAVLLHCRLHALALSLLKLSPLSQSCRHPPWPVLPISTMARTIVLVKLLEHLLSLSPVGSIEDNCW